MHFYWVRDGVPKTKQTQDINMHQYYQHRGNNYHILYIILPNYITVGSLLLNVLLFSLYFMKYDIFTPLYILIFNNLQFELVSNSCRM